MNERTFRKRLITFKELLSTRLDHTTLDYERFGLLQYHEAWVIVHLGRLDFPQYIPPVSQSSEAGIIYHRTYQAGFLAALPPPDVYQRNRALRRMRWLFEQLSVEERRELGEE